MGGEEDLMRKHFLGRALIAGGLGLLARKVIRPLREANLSGNVVLITGSSRGLGWLLAREFAREGCRIVLCARDHDELKRGQELLTQHGAETLSIVCDVTDRRQVENMINRALQHFGRIDILVNNAGAIQVGPIQSMTVADFEHAMDVMFWGILYPTMAVLPHMKARQQGRIVNITSIGGKVSVPHLLPYSAAKFAATGFSEGLRAELASEGIQVTTIIPGLMRTGSFLNAEFKGQHDKEYTWFALSDNLPGISMDAEKAAREIVQATRLNEAERILTVPANLLARFNGLFPGLTSQMMALANRFILPSGQNTSRASLRGMSIDAQQGHGPLQTALKWGYSAAARFNQYPGPILANERSASQVEDIEV
jgi:NAD(P)-dependent dehydrogenase (short-subunit alcohol dehydrogenase family)